MQQQTEVDVTPGSYSPDDETGDGGAQEGVGDDGAQVPEEVSLEEARRRKKRRYVVLPHTHPARQPIRGLCGWLPHGARSAL